MLCYERRCCFHNVTRVSALLPPPGLPPARRARFADNTYTRLCPLPPFGTPRTLTFSGQFYNNTTGRVGPRRSGQPTATVRSGPRAPRAARPCLFPAAAVRPLLWRHVESRALDGVGERPRRWMDRAARSVILGAPHPRAIAAVFIAQAAMCQRRPRPLGSVPEHALVSATRSRSSGEHEVKPPRCGSLCSRCCRMQATPPATMRWRTAPEENGRLSRAPFSRRVVRRAARRRVSAIDQLTLDS